MAHSPTTYPRLNIYLDDPELRTQIKIAAARRGVSISSYCLEAIRERLAREGQLTVDDERTRRRQEAARRMDAFRAKVGPIGVPVSGLVAEGRRFTEQA